MWLRGSVLVTILLSLSGCSDDEAATPGPSPSTAIDPEKPGPYAVGTTRFELAAHDSRTLPVQLWYPASAASLAEATTGHPLAEIEPPGSRRDTLSGLVAAAPEGCTTRTLHAAIDAAAAERSEPWPVVLFSHCHVCTRFSELAVAERLASWGFVVAAPDHEGNTVYDHVAGAPPQLSGEFLQTRKLDVLDVLDAVLDGAVIPASLAGHLDAERIGMFGHSFGSITTGLVLQDDARVKAGAMLAAPIPGDSVARVTQPGLFMIAEEDNSIGVAGNDAIQQNYDNYPTPAWLVTVKDAGHWSFSDIAGMTDVFAPGCGTAKRQSDPAQTFTYLDPALGRGIAQAYVTAFFGAQLLNQTAAAAYLTRAKPEGVVTVAQR